MVNVLIHYMNKDSGSDTSVQHQDCKMVISRISALQSQLVRNNPIVKAMADVKDIISSSYQTQVMLIEESKRKWFDVPWILSECLIQYLVHLYLSQTTTIKNLDLYQQDKQNSFQISLDSMFHLADWIVIPEHDKSSLRLKFTNAIQFALWGNQNDLCLLINVSDTDLTAMQTSSIQSLQLKSSNLIVNDSLEIAELVSKFHSTSCVLYVLDNAGLELVSDLCLAYLFTKTTGCQVVFECKNIPWFVSDVTQNDLEWVVQQCFTQSENQNLKSVAQEWVAWLESGKWKVRANKFWTTPYTFWDLPDKAPALYQEMIHVDLIIFKGDLNYRKLIHDVDWPTGTSFREALGPLADCDLPPIVALRTCKSKTIAQITTEQEVQLNEKDAQWRYNGTFGVIQLHKKEKE